MGRQRMTNGFSELKIPKWRLYLLLFMAVWAIGVAVTFAGRAHVSGHEVWHTVLYEAASAALLTLFLYFLHKDQK